MSEHRGPTIASNGMLRAIRCVNCGFTHLDPLPSDNDLYYQQDKFYHQHSPIDWFEKELKEYKNGYWDAAYKYQSWLLATGNRLCDIGAGIGTFVDFFPSMAIGLEPSRSAVEFGKKYVCGNALIEGDNPTCLPYKRGVHIRMALVLEHILHPKEFILSYKPLLGQSGRMMIVVPNEFNPLQRRLAKKHGNWFLSGVHLNYFTPYTLVRLLKSCGLEILHLSTTFPMELAAVLGYDYIGNESRGRRVHKTRLLFEKALGVNAYKLYEDLYNKYQWGREIIVVAGMPEMPNNSPAFNRPEWVIYA